MGRKPKIEELKNPEYISKLTDDQVYEYIFNEIRKNLPNPNLPLILTTQDIGEKPQKVGAYYAKVGKLVREGEFIYQNTDIKYAEYVNGRWLTGGGYNVHLKISDYDCVNTSPTRHKAHPNETWVDYVNSLVEDKEYIGKAKKYMEETYPEFFEERKKGKVYIGDGKILADSDKASMHV